jgi:hypothetical protein
VSALVDGVLLQAETDVMAFWFQGLVEGTLGLQAKTADRRWDFVIKGSLTGNACSYVTLSSMPMMVTTDLASFSENASCDVSLTHWAPNVGDILEGTFSAELKSLGGSASATVTDGRFRAPRVAESPF